MRNRVQEIHAKKFDMMQGSMPEENDPYVPIDFAKLKVGLKKLDDAVVNYGDMRRANPRLSDKDQILRAIANYDLPFLREVSDFFYRSSGIYARILRYMAFMYRYDWYVTPYVKDKTVKEEKILDNFTKCLDTLDAFNVKKTFGEIALKVLRHGVYYGYKVEFNNEVTLQELHPNYCRSRLSSGRKPAVEFNMKFFDDYFKDTAQRLRVLKIFPEEFQKGYSLYKQGKLVPDFSGDDAGWYLLDPAKTVRFTANGEEYPAFISAIPLILDYDAAQDLDKKRTAQRLLKLVIQKLPLDKNGDLIFDIDEAQQLHNNAVQMLGRAIGVDVLTTFADVDVESIADSSVADSQSDDLDRVLNAIYTDAGVSQLQFNSDGNIALSNSILNDEATMLNLLMQFEDFLNEVIARFNTQKKKYEFRVQMLPTTVYNYKDLSKAYKEETQLGFSKMLPQIALGISQSSILSTAYFENDILNLAEVLIPPLQSSVMNADAIRALHETGGTTTDSENSVGRPEKSDSEKSDKTLQNLESQS